ncbi:MAG: polysaccharide biosynthesis tyrosine autokinase [Bacteroidota bacterium]
MSYPISSRNQSSPEEIPIRPILAAVAKRWYLFAIAGLCTLILGNLYVRSQPEEYMVRASILIQGQDSKKASSDEFMKEMGLFASTSGEEDKIGVLTSSSLIEQALSHLPVGVSYFSESLFSLPMAPEEAPLRIVLDSTHLQLVGLEFQLKPIGDTRIRMTAKGKKIPVYDLQADEIVSLIPKVEVEEVLELGQDWETQYGKFQLLPQGNQLWATHPGVRFQIHSRYDLVNAFQKKLEVSPISEESNILQLRTSGSLINMEKQFLSELLLAFEQHEITTKSQLGQKAAAFIDQQIEQVTDSLRQAENQMESYRARSEIVDVSTTSSALTTQLVRMEEERADISMRLNYFRSIQEQLTNPENSSLLAPFPGDVQNPVLTNLMVELGGLMQQKAQVDYTSSTNNPIRERLDQQIADTRSALQSNIGSLIQSNEINLDGLDQKIATVQGKIRRLPRNEKELNQLSRQFESIGNLYNYLIEKRTEAGIALGNTSTDFLILDKPRLSSTRPVAPKKILIYLGCLLVGMGLPFLLIVVQFLFNERITDFSDIKSLTEIPVLGSVAKHEAGSIFLTEKESYSLLAESFRSVRIHLNYLTTEAPKQLVAITSSKSGEGKSFCAANLSSILAQSNKSTLLIDLDMRMPSQEDYLGTHEGPGMTEYLKGEATQSDIIQPTTVQGLSVIFAGEPFHNPLDLIDTTRFKSLMTRLRKKYDYLILDLPPMSVTSDYFILKKHIDYTIYITRQKVSTLQDLHYVDELYRRGKISDIGIVVNDTEGKGYHSYGYGYGYTPNKKDQRTGNPVQKAIKRLKLSV